MKVKVDLSALEREEVFTWKSDDGKFTLHFRTGAMVRFLKDNPEYAAERRVTTILDPSFAKHIKDSRGLEAHHLATITQDRLDVPLIGCIMDGDHEVLLVDGHHRYWLRYLKGESHVDYYLLPSELWQHFLMTDEDWEARRKYIVNEDVSAIL